MAQKPGELHPHLSPAHALGYRLRTFRERKGLSQAQLGNAIHCSADLIRKIEHAQRAAKFDVIKLCDDYLGASGQLTEQWAAAKNDDPASHGHRQSKQAASNELPDGIALGLIASASEPEVIVLRLQVEGKEVLVPVSRRRMLQAGIGSFVEAFDLGQQLDLLNEYSQLPRPPERIAVAASAHFEQIMDHLAEQWHSLVKTDNLLGPRFALASVLNQISILRALQADARDQWIPEVVRLQAQYAESAAWLFEDSGDIAKARYWTTQAMQWAAESNDQRMLAWTTFRRSQQAAGAMDAGQAIALAQAARQNEEQLATPTRAAIRVQEAYSYALDGNEIASQRLLDQAHSWAATDTIGDAHQGHGSYCTPGHIEIQRANCWLTTGKPKKAIQLYEDALRIIPHVYQRNRAAGLSRLAMAYLANGQPEQAAIAAQEALPVARSSGAARILKEIHEVSGKLAPHQSLHAVAGLAEDLHREDA